MIYPINYKALATVTRALTLSCMARRSCIFDYWHEGVHGWQTGAAVGEGDRLPKDPHCRRDWSDDAATRARRGVGGVGAGGGVCVCIVWAHARPSCSPFLSNPPPHRTSPPSTQCCEHIGGVVARGKQLCLAAINPRDVIHELLTINSLSVCKCG